MIDANLYTHKLQFYKGRNKKWRFRIIARNGNKIMQSGESYANITMARKSALNMMEAFERFMVVVETIKS